MNEIVIRIKTDNDAFQGHACIYEVQRILKGWISKSTVYGEPIESALTDINGNTVGKVVIETITKEDE